MERKEYGFVLLKSLGVTGIIIVLIYRSLWAAVLFPFVFLLLFKEEKRRKKERRKIILKEEFLHGITVLNNSLQAGFSMENAWREVEKELQDLYGRGSELYQEIRQMNQRVLHNEPIEKLLLEFAFRCQVEEVIQFAELLEYGKRSGSNWKKIIDVTVSQLTEQNEAKQQIEVMMAEKKMEQAVMNIMPLGLLAFMQVFAWDYMGVLYHNWLGVICMSVFLMGYVGAIFVSQRILRVQL